MRNMYARWIGSWEHRLASRDTNRVVRPFDWGHDWLGEAPATDSESFFPYQPPREFHQENGTLRFASAVESPYPENNEAVADWFPTDAEPKRAVVVVPQWNADRASHRGLCKLLNRSGISALRLTKPYHGPRKPPESPRTFRCG